MKTILAAAWVFGVAIASNLGAAPLTLNFAAVSGANVTFDGSGHFGFTNTSGYDFMFTSSSGGTDSATGLKGNIDAPLSVAEPTSTAFTIGAITDLGGGHEFASVTGSSELLVQDSFGHTLTGNLSFVRIDSLGATGALNGVNAVINLTGLSYDGNNPDLQSLFQSGSGIVTATYQFGSNETLDQLVGTNVATSYSGSITATPEPAWYALPLLAMNGGLLFLWRRKKAQAAE